jgi:O-antigen/teichoic acid export membrane protein
MGAVAFAQSTTSYFSLVALLGITNYGVKVCAQVRNDRSALSKTVKELIVILLVSTTLVFIVFVMCLFFVPQFSSERLLFLCFGLSIWLSSFGVEWFYQALEQYGYITVRNLCFKLISLILMFVFIKHQGDYVLYGLIIVFAGYGSNVLNILRLGKLIDFHDKQRLNIKRHFKPMRWYVIASVCSGMYIQVDIVLLGFLGTQSMVGLYQLVSKIKTVLVSVVNSVGNVMLPRLSYYQASDKKGEAGQLIAKNINFVLVLGGMIIPLLAICSRPIVLIMGGPNYVASARPLSIVGFAAVFSAMNIVLGNYLISRNAEKQWALVNLAGLILAIISNLLLIPLLGIVGAALSITICEGCMLIMRGYICRNFLKLIIRQIDFWQVVVSSLCASAIVSVFLHFLSVHNIFVFIVASTAIFMVIYGIALVVTRERFVNSVLSSLKKKYIGR